MPLQQDTPNGITHVRRVGGSCPWNPTGAANAGHKGNSLNQQFLIVFPGVNYLSLPFPEKQEHDKGGKGGQQQGSQRNYHGFVAEAFSRIPGDTHLRSRREINYPDLIPGLQSST